MECLQRPELNSSKWFNSFLASPVRCSSHCQWESHLFRWYDPKIWTYVMKNHLLHMTQWSRAMMIIIILKKKNALNETTRCLLTAKTQHTWNIHIIITEHIQQQQKRAKTASSNKSFNLNYLWWKHTHSLETRHKIKRINLNCVYSHIITLLLHSCLNLHAHFFFAQLLFRALFFRVSALRLMCMCCFLSFVL